MHTRNVHQVLRTKKEPHGTRGSRVFVRACASPCAWEFKEVFDTPGNEGNKVAKSSEKAWSSAARVICGAREI